MTLNKNSFYAKFYRRFVDKELPTYFCTFFWGTLLTLFIIPAVAYGLYTLGFLYLLYCAGLFIALFFPIRWWVGYWPTIEHKVCKKINWV